MQNGSYIISVRHNGSVSVLDLGSPTEGIVSVGTYDYYLAYVPDATGGALTLDLTVFSGDADLFVGTNASTLPTITNAQVERGCAPFLLARSVRARRPPLHLPSIPPLPLPHTPLPLPHTPLP